MRLTAYGFLFGAFASSGSNLIDTGGLAQGGALAVLGGTVWYMMIKAFPAHVESQAVAMRAFLKAIQKEREDFLEAQRDARVDNNESVKKLTSALEKMAESLRKRG